MSTLSPLRAALTASSSWRRIASSVTNVSAICCPVDGVLSAARRTCDRHLARDDVFSECAGEAQRDVRVRAARVVGIRRRDERRERSVFAIGDDELAVIRLEVQQREPAAQRDAGAFGREWIAHAAAGRRVAPPLQQRAPQRRIQRIRIAHPFQVRDHHIDSGLAQLREQLRGRTAVHIVDRIRQQQDLQLGDGLLAGDQMVRQLAAERTMRGAGCAHQLVDEKEVSHHEGARLVDDAEHFVEDALLVDQLVRVLRPRARQVVQELHVARRYEDRLRADIRAGRHRFRDVPHADARPQRQQGPGDPALAETAARWR